MKIIFSYLCDFFAPDFMLHLQLETNLDLSFNVSFVCGVYGNRSIKMAYSIFCTSFTFKPITTRVFRGFVTLGVVGGEQFSNQKDNNNQTWHKYSLFSHKHFSIKIYDVVRDVSHSKPQIITCFVKQSLESRFRICCKDGDLD